MASTEGTFTPGEIRDISDEIAAGLCRAGLAMQDKSEDGAREIKGDDESIYWCESCESHHRLSSKIGKRHNRRRR